MEDNPKVPTVLDTNQSVKPVWSKKDYERMKSANKINGSVRGSLYLGKIVKEIRIRLPGTNLENLQLDFDQNLAQNHDMIFQVQYGSAFDRYLVDKWPGFPYLLSMCNQDKYTAILETRKRMADWMLEVFRVYESKGSTENTYFQAMAYLDILTEKKRVDSENMHQYGIAAMHLASQFLDKDPITVDEAYRDLGHKMFTKKEIILYFNNAKKHLNFNLRVPTLIEYLDKLFYDIFGDYKENFAEFNLRQVAVFVLHACVYEVLFYAYNPYLLATVAIVYAVEMYFQNYIDSKDFSSSELLSTKSNKENLLSVIYTQKGFEKAHIKALFKKVNEHLIKVRKSMNKDDFKELAKLFGINV